VTTFKFRAQAALDLRARELAAAQRELARAEGVRDAARLRVTQADAEIVRARLQAAEAQQTAHTVTGHEWYRFWILRLVHERTAHAATLAARDEDVTRAAAACRRAHQRRESLDRFKEKARDAFDAAQQAAEMKLIDELATRRFAGRAFGDSHAAR
jgi:flagellar export protein FliJ